MRAVIQRVSGAGLLVLLGVEVGDDETAAGYLAKKTAELRIFEDVAGKMNRSVLDCAGEVLVVSQFTLLADCRKGRRPGFSAAAAPEQAEPLCEYFVTRLKESGLTVSTGQFRADMAVNLVNDGPVTLLLDSRKSF